MMIKSFASWVVLVVSICCCFNVYAQKTFVFTAIPDQDESRLVTRFSKVADYLEDNLGIKVKYIPVKSYSAAVAAFRNNQVQLGWFGGLSGVKARLLVPGSEAIAQGYEDQFFKTYFVANTKTGLTEKLNDLSAIKGRTFTFGSKGSTSGRLMPEFHIRQHFGEAPEKTFDRVGFSGDHSRTIALVQSGAYDVGAVNYKVWENALALGKIDLNKINVVWETPAYPDYQWSVRGDIDKQFGEGFKDKLKQALLAMKTPELLAAFPRESFVTANNSDYDAIAKVARNIGLID